MEEKISIGKVILSLTLTCIVSAVILAVVYNNTVPVIRNIEVRYQYQLKREIMPEGIIFKRITDTIEYGYDKYRNEVGRIYIGSAKGYAGTVQVLFGLDKDNKITKVRILSHKETPGLGSKIADISFLKQFTGKMPDKLVLKKDDPRGDIDAISGATISSRSVINAIKSIRGYK